jgi:hypothetical protein
MPQFSLSCHELIRSLLVHMLVRVPQMLLICIIYDDVVDDNEGDVDNYEDNDGDDNNDGDVDCNNINDDDVYDDNSLRIEVLANGGILSISGSRLLAEAAKYYSVPFVVCGGLYKLTPLYPNHLINLVNLNSPSQIIPFEEGNITSILNCFYQLIIIINYNN